MKDSTLKKYKQVIDEWFVNGKNGRAAYQSVYPKCKNDSASAEFLKILRIPLISEYVDQKQEEAQEMLIRRHYVGLGDLLREFTDIGIKGAWEPKAGMQEGVSQMVKTGEKIEALKAIADIIGAKSDQRIRLLNKDGEDININVNLNHVESKS